MNAKEANLTNFRKIVQTLNDSVEGSGNLLNQKSIAIVAGCGRASDANWLKHCIPGSSHHFTRLKQYPFLFTNSDQVMQLAHCLSSLGDQNGPMNGPKVDEVICKTLKGPSSDAMFHDIVIAGQELYYTKNAGSNLSIMCRRPRSPGVETRVETGGFASKPEAHYIPCWTEMCDVTEYSTLDIYMSSQTNYEFNLSSKSEKKIEKEPFHSILPSFDIHQIQVLLNKNLYFAFTEPYVFVSDYLGVDSQQLVQAITAKKTRDGGWIATVSQRLMESLNLQVPYVGILETEDVYRLPLFGIKSQTRSNWSYVSRLSATGSLLLHLLFNTRMTFKLHWTKPLLENTKELAILLPITRTFERTVLVCVIYREEGYVKVKQFQELNCKVMLPFEIGTYYTKAEQEQRDMLH